MFILFIIDFFAINVVVFDTVTTERFMENKKYICLSEAFKISIVIGTVSTLLTFFVFEFIFKIECTRNFLTYIFLGSVLISLVAARFGWFNKGNKTCD